MIFFSLAKAKKSHPLFFSERRKYLLKIIKCNIYCTTILGRSESKLKDVLSAASKATGIEGLEKSIPLVVCDVADPDSIVQMAKTTRLVISCFNAKNG